MSRKIILASASPRRKDLLKQIGLDFSIAISKVEENIAEGKRPFEVAEELALLKTQDIANKSKKGIVIGADTIVVLKDTILGKPKSEQEAKNMLRALSGKTHFVITGIAIIDCEHGKKHINHEMTEVVFRSLTDDEIESYVKSGEPMDKAGSYGIQGLGALLVEKINGCYFNVVGLPLTKLAFILREFGVKIL